MKFLILIFTVSILFTGCYKKQFDDVLFVNNSEVAIYTDICKYNSDTTMIHCFNDIKRRPDIYKFEPKEERVLTVPTTWEKIYQENDTMTFFIYDADIVENTSMDTITIYYLILDRYDYTYNDLKKRNWIITYPEE